MKTKPNLADELSREYYRSRTFKTILGVACGLILCILLIAACGFAVAAGAVADILSRF